MDNISILFPNKIIVFIVSLHLIINYINIAILMEYPNMYSAMYLNILRIPKSIITL